MQKLPAVGFAWAFALAIMAASCAVGLARRAESFGLPSPVVLNDKESASIYGAGDCDADQSQPKTYCYDTASPCGGCTAYYSCFTDCSPVYSGAAAGGLPPEI